MISNKLSKHPLPWLANCCPEFAISGKKVEILKEPSSFYEKLLELSRRATRRITLASLYIGSGPLEQQLVSCIHDGLANPNKNIKVKILLDFTRGSRGKDSSRALLLPLLKLFPSQLSVSLYHTPKLRGFLRWLLPERWNETIGLSHLKVYLFDDTLMLSGANLSDQYFVNREDRYVLFHDCKELADYFNDLVMTVCKFSFQLQKDNTLSLHPDWKVHPLHGSYNEFVTESCKSLQKFIMPFSSKSADTGDQNTDLDTLVYPLLQMYTLGITHEEQVVKKLLRTATPSSVIKLASGYFNLTNSYMDVILNSSDASFSLLVASPKVNGFYGAKGLAGAIPMVYTNIAKQFYQRILKSNQQHRVKLYEYERKAWTYHAKGIWYYMPDEVMPSVSLIGSPNFGYRSVYKDLEAQVAIITENRVLQEELDKEQSRFYERTTTVTSETFQKPDRRIPFWIKLITFFIRDFF